MLMKAIQTPELQYQKISLTDADASIQNAKAKTQKQIKFIDLFAGMGGIRIGFQDACHNLGFGSECVFSSEIKEHAVSTYLNNFKGEKIHGDITKINAKDIPNFDYLLAGFPCQAFSVAGKRRGFDDIRGTLFFDIVRILKEKKPQGFILENVEGLVKHNNGKTFEIIIKELTELKYHVSSNMLNSANFGVPQNRNRIYIVGHINRPIELTSFNKRSAIIKDIIDDDATCKDSPFVKTLLKFYSHDELAGKSIKDRRGGANNIHSWDIELKGVTTKEQKNLMNLLLKKRRMKHWAIKKGITWMDGMPLTANEIKTFYSHPDLQEMLDDLSTKGYLKYEHPKNIFIENGVKIRKYDTSKEKGYNIVAGKLSFPLSTILCQNTIAPTIVATEIGKIAVATKRGIRNFTIKEGLGLFGYPKNYNFGDITYKNAFDLLGNTVIPPVVKEVAKKLLLNS